jgi:phosphatidate cytidylyltransferase
MATVVMLAMLPGGNSGLLLLFAVVWLGDTAAYFGGKSLGRRKLYARVSPKKTLEGSFFGLLGSVLGAFLVDAVWGTPLSWYWLVVAGVAGGVAEQAGDLCESLLKRSAGIKDSGSILPGHGGMLDRIDGLLFGAPVIYGIYLVALGGF